MKILKRTLYFSPIIFTSLLLNACIDNSDNKSITQTPPAAPASAQSPATPDNTPQLKVTSLEIAQTHVLPAKGLDWSLQKVKQSLHLIAQRNALAIIDLGDATPQQPMIEAWFNDSKLGTVTLTDKLPSSEAAGPVYATHRYSGTLPADWLKPGLRLRITANNYRASDFNAPNIGMDAELDMYILPFYLFGANDSNTFPLTQVATPDQKIIDELYAKWPVAKLNMRNHPIKKIDWPYMIIGPRNNDAAYKVINKDQQKDGYAIMGSVLSVLSAIRSANGESATNNQYYGPLLMLGKDGTYANPWGGLGSIGGSVGTGDHLYSGIFIHEQGHAFGMPHALDAYNDGSYPYINGSLLGSAWGYDANHNELLPPYMPSTSSNMQYCLSGERKKDSAGRCIKQDVMQGGHGDQDPSYLFTMFSDFNAGVMQRYFEGVTTIDNTGVHQYEGGKIFVDTASPTGYSRWDSIDQKRIPVTPTTVSNGLYGFNMGLPSQRNVPVQTIIVTYSLAGTPDVSQIYPPLSYQGNLLRQIDPTDPAQRAEIVPNTGKTAWYCHASGCDYTLRVSYSDGSQSHILLQGSGRPWFKPSDPFSTAALDPLQGDSFKTWGVNVAANKSIRKIELLDTPMGWNGVPDNPRVLLSR